MLLEAPAITEAQLPAATTAPAPRLTAPVSSTSSLMPLDIATRPALPTGLGGMSSTTTILAKSSPSPQLSPPSCYLATLPSLQLSPLHPSCPPVPQVPAIPPGFERPPSTADATSLPAAAAIEPPAAAGHALEPTIPLSQARHQPIYQEGNCRLREAPVSSTPTPSAAPLPERQAAAPEGAEQYLPPELYALALASEEDVPEDDPLWDSA